MRNILCIFLILSIICVCACSCGGVEDVDIAATTLPVYEFTVALCEGTDLNIAKLIDEDVSCLHDYTLQVSQMRMLERADVVVISGAGLETFLDDIIGNQKLIDASEGISLLCPSNAHEDEHAHHAHDHEHDPHIWLSPENARLMAQNIYEQLYQLYPQYATKLSANWTALSVRFDKLQAYGESELSELAGNEIITFHDGFAYLADAYGLNILHAIEEESGSEASAAELISLIELVRTHKLNAIFTEVGGSTSAASVIQAETNISVYSLDMGLSSNSYFDAMYYNIATLKEALE